VIDRRFSLFFALFSFLFGFYQVFVRQRLK